VIPIVIATKPDGSAFGNLFFASEAPRKGVSSLSPDNVLAAEVNACCNAEQASAERALNQGGGLSQPSWSHTWPPTGITIYLENDERLEHAQQMAVHESPRTTKLYDRTKEEITLTEVERIRSPKPSHSRFPQS